MRTCVQHVPGSLLELGIGEIRTARGLLDSNECRHWSVSQHKLHLVPVHQPVSVALTLALTLTNSGYLENLDVDRTRPRRPPTLMPNTDCGCTCWLKLTELWGPSCVGKIKGWKIIKRLFAAPQNEKENEIWSASSYNASLTSCTSQHCTFIIFCFILVSFSVSFSSCYNPNCELIDYLASPCFSLIWNNDCWPYR